ncbi:TetR/AcrR family transcriptional regulator [Actinoplanes rectilineatus]|uniref:TetR/AcrR family transcriptional regulator n=1 Tax=Actinoplanes rectilineatus TaxID=113571 RepID=UPI000698D084|nr:TetR/AcrR family transcriptional regulator [Actinoplanes rectilineatus]
MTQATGNTRPGGRTARTREAVHAAVRELLAASPDTTIGLPEVAARAGVHPATVYRRWRTAEALLLDVAFTDVSERSPVPATGDLRADLLTYAHGLAEAVVRPGGLGLIRAYIAAMADPVLGLAGADALGRPRMEQFQAMLDAAGAVELTPVDVFEMIHSPLYIAAMILNGRPRPDDPAMPGDPGRLVATVLAVLASRRAAARDDTGDQEPPRPRRGPSQDTGSR